MTKRQLKTQNANRNSIEVKVTLKPEQCKLMDSAIQILFGDEMSRSQFLKICLNDKLRKVTFKVGNVESNFSKFESFLFQV